MSKTLDAIESANLIFISAQPDVTYFHWQVELYMYQFAKHGIGERCYALFGYKGDAPSERVIELSKRYNIYYYKDTRDTNIPHYYIPSIRPHLLKQFFKEFPELGKSVFYHDSDIILPRLPKFELLLNDSYGYLSDTSSYINYTYIKQCAQRYKDVHTEIADNDILTKMCECMNISEDLIKMNDNNSGGAQYLLKGIDANYWENVEINVNKLYYMLREYEIKHPIGHHIQSWTADMWAVLWEYWKLGRETRIHLELEFSWATDSIDRYDALPIFHLAGITDSDALSAFYKGRYKDSDVFDEYRRNRSIFNHINQRSATYPYSNLIKEYVDSDSYICTKSFIILTKDSIGGLYKEDPRTIYNNKAVWRSNVANYIIFYNSSKWILADSNSDISDSLEGIAFNTGEYPYIEQWSIPCKILKS